MSSSDAPPAPGPSPANIPAAGPSGSAQPAAAQPAAAAAAAAKPPLEPLTGFRASLEHTGLPRSVLTYKPRLPSRNWLIFWSVLGSVSYLYWSDRRECDRIKEEYTRRAKVYGQQPLEGGSMGEVRRVRVWAARWAEDEDTDRGLRYFRKYVKPYLVAAAIDYDQTIAPLHGSITRMVRAEILSKRRVALGLEAGPIPLSLPGTLDPAGADARAREGGTVLVGRATLKEYMEGLKRGWGGGVGRWKWEDEVEEGLKGDGVFDLPAQAEGHVEEPAQVVAAAPAPLTHSPTGLAFLSRPKPVNAPSPQGDASPVEVIPPHWHVPPSPLPPQPPLLLIPWRNALGFTQVPWMVSDFFTERYRVREGAELAWALIRGETRPLEGPTEASGFVSDTSEPANSPAPRVGGDLDLDYGVEKWYKRKFADLPARTEQARKDYYADLPGRLADVRALASGEREMTKEEAKAAEAGRQPMTEEKLREERLKRELRWKGMMEGWGIVRGERGVRWEEGWRGWLEVFRLPEGEGWGGSNGKGNGEGAAKD